MYKFLMVKRTNSSDSVMVKLIHLIYTNKNVQTTKITIEERIKEINKYQKA